MDRNGNPADHDHLGHGGAVELARRLRRYWRDRGYEIETTVDTILLGQRVVYSVRSNLVRGLPPADTKIAMDEAA